MQYRPFGKTGRMLSFLGIRPRKGPEMLETLRRGFSRGINYIDIDPEELSPDEMKALGSLLEETAEAGHPLYIGVTLRARKGAALRRSAEKILSLLDRDVIDFCHLGPFSTPEEWTQLLQSGILDAARRGQDDGFIRHLTLESTGVDSVVTKAAEDVASLIDGLNLHGPALTFPFHEAGARFFDTHHKGIMVHNSFAAGFRKKAKREYAFLKAFPDQSLLEASLHFMMSCEHLGLVVTQFETPEQVERSIGAVEEFQGYSADQLAQISRAVEEQLHKAEALRESPSLQKADEAGLSGPPDEVDFLVFRLLDSIGSFLGDRKDAIVGRRRFRWGRFSDELNSDESSEKK